MNEHPEQTAFFVVVEQKGPGRDENGDPTTVTRVVDLGVFPKREDADKHAAGIGGASVVERKHEHDPRWSQA